MIPLTPKPLLDSTSQTRFNIQKDVWRRDRSITGNLTCSFVRDVPDFDNPESGVYIEGQRQVVRDSVPCYARNPTVEEKLAGVFMEGDRLIIIYDYVPELDLVIELQGHRYIIVSLTKDATTGRCRIQARDEITEQ